MKHSIRTTFYSIDPKLRAIAILISLPVFAYANTDFTKAKAAELIHTSDQIKQFESKILLIPQALEEGETQGIWKINKRPLGLAQPGFGLEIVFGDKANAIFEPIPTDIIGPEQSISLQSLFLKHKRQQLTFKVLVQHHIL